MEGGPYSSLGSLEILHKCRAIGNTAYGLTNVSIEFSDLPFEKRVRCRSTNSKIVSRSENIVFGMAYFSFLILQGFVPLAELEVIREQHDLELKNIQDEYELKVQQLLTEIEKMQTIQMHQV